MCRYRLDVRTDYPNLFDLTSNNTPKKYGKCGDSRIIVIFFCAKFYRTARRCPVVISYSYVPHFISRPGSFQGEYMLADKM